MGLEKIKKKNFLHEAAEFKEPFDDKLSELIGTTQKLKPNAILVNIADQTVSVSEHPQLNQELQKLTIVRVIKPVEKLTLWVSQLVLPKKKMAHKEYV